jgi:DGQHR domain-containing protein
MDDLVCLSGIVGHSAHCEVLLGFAPASLLYEVSFADVLDEDTGRGYQRCFNSQHSQDFRRYIHQSGSATIPLTFNVRPPADYRWELIRTDSTVARLQVCRGAGKVLAQVDCQHRLGYLSDSPIALPFMCFLGLSEREEMEIFNTINSKAKGLSTSLLNYHQTKLAGDLASERPELFIALHLNSDLASPWYRQLDLGGQKTSGLMRRASLRTMQTAVKRFLHQTNILKREKPETAAQIVRDFWGAVPIVAADAWRDARHHLINKGVGVYALMTIAADLYLEANPSQRCDQRYFTTKLADFLGTIDWTVNGQLKGFGGETGVTSAVALLRAARSAVRLRFAPNVQ